MYSHISTHFSSFVLGLSLVAPSTFASLLDVLPRAVQTSVPNITSYTNPETFQADVLNSTNFYRYEHNATALTWNSSLASFAQSWASQCQWRGSNGPYGENLAVGFHNVAEAVDAWGNERAKYNFTTPTGFSEATGHFTQLVWKRTTSTGCAAVNCTGKGGMHGFYLVCEYHPTGNVVGDHNAFFVQNVQSQIHNSGPTGTSTGVAMSTTTTATTANPTNRSTRVATNTSTRVARSTTTAVTSANPTGQTGLGNEGTPGPAARGLWTLAALVMAMGLAGGMI